MQTTIIWPVIVFKVLNYYIALARINDLWEWNKILNNKTVFRRNVCQDTNVILLCQAIVSAEDSNQISLQHKNNS